ncbi:MAG: hypothetical protein ACI9DG_001393 [Oleispira sp.]
MSETSTEKTKRNQINLLTSYKWVNQISYFYLDYEDSRHILKEGIGLRKRIGRLNPNTAFLCKLRFMNRPANDIENSPSGSNKVVMPYWTIYSTKAFSPSEAAHFLPKTMPDGIYTKKRAIRPYHIENAARAIKGQKLYNVEKHLGTKAKSFYIINKSMLSEYQLTQESTSEEQDTQTPEGFF